MASFIMFVNVVKGMEETKFSKVFVYYIIQTSNLSEYFTRIKSIIISKNEWNFSNPQSSS